MLLSVTHHTVYRYREPVSRSTQVIRMTPHPCARQRTVHWQVEMPARAALLRDALDNITHVLTLDYPHQEISLVASGQVHVDDADDGEPAGAVNPAVFLRTTALTAPDDALREFVAPMHALTRSRPLVAITDLMGAVAEKMPYEAGHTSAQFTAAQSFAAGRGVCQDHSHVFIACCRMLGVPCRYVSGYLYTNDLEHVASHAWAEAWVSNRWVSFDVSNAAHAGGEYVKLAVGLDYLDACPVRGVRLGGGEEELWTTAQVSSGAQQ